ncbi:MAG: dihydroorotate dehydrogenase [Treponema sp.]|jgi:dihydroorotate dehydrogenase (NAD+) catalytic subunit|nr:dihydroorotate dehydrogenase [Treponema sp.]
MEHTVPVLGRGTVTCCTVEPGARPEGSVFLLKICFAVPDTAIPVPGQFFMLRSMQGAVLLGRPISVFHYTKTADGVDLEFLILEKGPGTGELCRLETGDSVELLGPLGNIFPAPQDPERPVCIIGGGIGIAPVAGFAETLPPESYDFFASYKSGSYGLEHIHPRQLVITTDDGSVGIMGMFPVALDAAKLRAGAYREVYACGPAPLLAYVQQICAEADVPCWISMEQRMACGMGVCLGCTIPTTEGNKRCCKEGPVFNASVLIFEKPKSVPRLQPLHSEPDLSVVIGGVRLRNPVIASSGTFGFGTEYMPVMDVNALGAICSKGVTLEPREGNSGTRLWETPSGLMNSIGLQNPGIPHFITYELQDMLRLEPVIIANLSGSTLESYVEGAKLLDKTAVPLVELNISCPNVSTGGAAWGMECDAANRITAAVRAVTTKPLIVKLTPQAPDPAAVAMACRKAGADAISLCNSFQGVAVDIERGVPVFDKVKAGFGGPAVRPMAVRLVYETAQAMNRLPETDRIPIIGIGGLADWRDAVEFIMAGASAVAVGTTTFARPTAMIEIISGLSGFMKRKGYRTIDDMRGIILK